MTLTLTDENELGTIKKGLVIKHTQVKYEGLNSSYQSKDMANVKDFADKQTDNRTSKNYMPPPPNLSMRGHKNKYILNRKRNVAHKKNTILNSTSRAMKLSVCVMIKFWCSGNLLLLNFL